MALAGSSGPADAFCASVAKFSTRDSKIMYDEMGIKKGNMFSFAEGDFQVPKSGFYMFLVSFATDLCGSLSLCGPTTVALR